MLHSTIKFHPNMLKIFRKEELLELYKISDYSKDRDGNIDVMLVRTDKIFVEIFVDCEAKDVGHALINNLDSDNGFPIRLSKEQFWEIFTLSKPIKVCDCEFEVAL